MLNVYEELGETSRRQILSELRSGPKNVSDLVESTGLKQPNVSNHLARMRSRGIVKASKVGRQVFYTIASSEIESILLSVFASTKAEPAQIEWDSLAKQYAKSAVVGDESGCSEILDSVFRAEMPMLEIYQELISSAMKYVGTWYKVGAIDEGQEHMASAITERMMSRTVMIAGPTRRHGLSAILGCGPDNWHVIGLRMLADYLKLCGWKTLFMGANVPIKSFVNAVKNHEPDMVLTSCSAEESIESALKLLEALQVARPKLHPFVVGIGGAAVFSNPDRFDVTGVDFKATDLRAFANEILPNVEKNATRRQNR